MTTGKTIALTTWTFVNKVMSLLFNMLSRLVTAFLLRSKCLLISWLQLLSTVILEPKKIKSLTVSIFPSSICPWNDGSGCHIPHKRSQSRKRYILGNSIYIKFWEILTNVYWPKVNEVLLVNERITKDIKKVLKRTSVFIIFIMVGVS